MCHSLNAYSLIINAEKSKLNFHLNQLYFVVLNLFLIDTFNSIMLCQFQVLLFKLVDPDFV